MTAKPLSSLYARIPGPPRAWARTALVDRGGRARRVTPAGYRDWKTMAAEALAAFAGYRRFEPGTQLAVRVTVYADGVEVSAAALDAGTRPAGITGDIDNYAKAVLDGMTQAGVFDDDRQVSALVVAFDPGRMPR